MSAGMLGLVDTLPATDADWTMMAGGFVSVPSTTGTVCRDSRSLVEAFVSSMTPSVRAMMYDVTSNITNRASGMIMKAANNRKVDAEVSTQEPRS